MTEAPCAATTSRPEIVCLIGSTRFKAEYKAAARGEELAGNIALPAHVFGNPEPDQKQRLDDLQLEKILLADKVLLLNVCGYIGESTGNALAYALALKKPVRTLEPMDLEKWAGERDAKARAAGEK